MTGDTRPAPIGAPARRVSLTVTGYLIRGHPVGGFYDMQSDADGGVQYSIPAFEVDEASVKDAPPEVLTVDDWDEIRGYVMARYGPQDGARLIEKWRRVAGAIDEERGAP